MKLDPRAKSLLKALATIAIFVAIFAEFGGGPVPVSKAALTDGSALFQANPDSPGFIGKLKAKVTGAALPDPHKPLTFDAVCKTAAENTVFVKTTAGDVVKLKALRHCVNDVFTDVLPSPTEDQVALSATTGDTVYLLKQGFQLVPMDMRDLWNEIRAIDLATFLPWFLFAMGIKLAGIFANILRWQVLLAGQGVRLGFGWLTASYFVGRYWGIVTPSTMGLDGWRLYDTIRATRKPVECTTAIAVERVIGLVGLLTVILAFMPFAGLDGKDLADVMKALAFPIAAAIVFGLLLLMRPAMFHGLVRFIPNAKFKSFFTSAIDSATAYSSNRRALLIALACAVFGQVTTMFMYFGNAMALDVKGASTMQILYASAVMTLGTFLAPSASGEGVRELVFVTLLHGKTTAAKAFLIGHLGFWIEKLPLSLPGGWFMLRAPAAYQRVTQDDLARLKAEVSAENAS
jgi:uncharacterized membrane protein YbhN (UPF0104 family)